MAKNTKVKQPEMVDFKDDLLNYLVNISPYSEAAVKLAEAKFLYHAAAHHVFSALSRKQTEIMDKGHAHAVYYLASCGYLHGRKGKGSQRDLKEYLAREADDIINLLRDILHHAAQENWRLAQCYGRLCNVKAEPGWFDPFKLADPFKDTEL